MAVKDYSTTPDLNVQISGINIAEGCPPSGINNAIRQLMADVKVEQDTRDAEQATRDAEQDEAIAEAKSSADAAKTTADNALPKSGGTMTGTLESSAGRTITGVSTAERLLFTSAPVWTDGAWLHLSGKDSTYNGNFQLSSRAANGSGGSLIGEGDVLTWCGKNIVRSVNGVAADAAGNVAIFDSGSWDDGTTGGWWIRYKNNFQIINIAYALGHTGQDIWIPFPKPFNSTGYASVVTPDFYGTANSNHDGITGKTTTGCTYHSMHGKGTYSISVSGIFMGWWS